MIDKREALNRHNRLREQAEQALSRAAKLADERESTILSEGTPQSRGDVLRDMAGRLHSDKFTLAVVGEFSRGKSTLINALLGREELLPTAIEPATAAITVLTYGETPQATVHYADGSTQADVLLEDLPKYVLGKNLDGSELQSHLTRKVAQFTRRKKLEDLTVEEVQANVREHLAGTATHDEVTTVEVSFPSEFLAEGIRLVDTPGIGSVNPKHGEATRSFVREADAVLFLINTNPPIGGTECNFLSFLKDYVEHFIFAVTQIDRYEASEQERSLNYTRDTIIEHTGIAKPRIFPVSARQALQGQLNHDNALVQTSGFPVFLRSLDEMLVEGRGHRMVKQYVNEARLHVNAMRKAIDVERQAIDLNLDELRQRLEASAPELQRARAAQRTIVRRLDSELEDVYDLICGETGTDWLRLTAIIREEVSDQIDQCSWEQLQQAAELIPIFVREVVNEETQTTLERVVERLQTLRGEIIQECQSAIQTMNDNLAFDFEDLAELSEADFEFKLDPELFRADLKKVSTVTVGSTLALALASGFLFGGIGALIMLGGGVVAGTKVTSVFRNKARQQLKDEIEKPLGDLMDGMQENLQREISDNLKEFRAAVSEGLDRAIHGVEESLEKLAGDVASAQQTAPERREELVRQRLEIDNIGSLLQQAGFLSA